MVPKRLAAGVPKDPVHVSSPRGSEGSAYLRMIFPQPGGCTKTTMPPSQQQKLLVADRQEAQAAILIRPTGEVDLTSVPILWSNLKALLEVWSACRRRPECNSAHGLQRIRGVAGLFSRCECISHQGWPSTPSSTTPSAGRQTLNPIGRVRTELRWTSAGSKPQ